MATFPAKRPALHAPATTAGPLYWTMVAVLLVAVAVAAYVLATRQLTLGLGVTGMNTPAYWGLYIVNFVFLIGLSAGGIIVAALSHALGVRRFESIGRVAELGAISCLILATIFITLDMGRPDRLWHLLIYGRLASPLVWDVIVIVLYLAMALALGYFSTRRDLVRLIDLVPGRARLYRLLALGYTDLSPQAMERDGHILKALAISAIPMAVALHSVTAWIMGLLKAQPGWHSALIAPLFVTSAVISGLALVIVSVLVGRIVLRISVADEVILGLGKILTFGLPVLGYFLFAELLTVVYARETAPLAIFHEMIFGKFAMIFWFDLVVGILVPLAILTAPRASPENWPWRVLSPTFRPAFAGAAVVAVIVVLYALGRAPQAALAFGAWTPIRLLLLIVLPMGLVIAVPYVRPGTVSAVATASALVVIGVFAERSLIVLPSQLNRLLPYPVGSYTPTAVEWLITAGVYALGALAFLVLGKIIPLVPLGEEDLEDPARRRPRVA